MGKFSLPKTFHEKYETGQFFLHRVFGYRGVILFPWKAKIYDRNTYASSYSDQSTSNSSASANEVDPSTIGSVTSDDTVSTSPESKQSARSAKKQGTMEADSVRNDGKKEVTVDVQTYYQVLIDSRDCPHVVCFWHT